MRRREDDAAVGRVSRIPDACGLVAVCINPHMDSRTIIAALLADGWKQVSQKGSHCQFKHSTKPGRVTVPHPERDIPVGTLRSIEKQAGLKLR